MAAPSPASPYGEFIHVRSDLDECWAMATHSPAGVHSPVGELLTQAKYTRPLGDADAMAKLAASFTRWCMNLSRMGRSKLAHADVVIPVPAKPRSTV